MIVISETISKVSISCTCGTFFCGVNRRSEVTGQRPEVRQTLQLANRSSGRELNLELRDSRIRTSVPDLLSSVLCPVALIILATRLASLVIIRTGEVVPKHMDSNITNDVHRPRRSSCMERSRALELERIKRLSVQERIAAALTMGTRFAWLKPEPKDN